MKCILGGIVVLALISTAWGMDADLTLQQLNHKGWAVADGAPGAIYAITQTPDGTLWVAGPSGLSRFDGIRFVRYDGTLGRDSHMRDITALAAAPDGSLWMGFGLGGITVLSAKGTVQYDYRNGLSTSTVNSIAMDAAGHVFAATSRGMFQFHGDRWQAVDIDSDSSARVAAATVDRHGTLWALTSRFLWARRAGESHFSQIAPRGNDRRIGANSLSVAPDGTLWVLDLNHQGAIARVATPDAGTRGQVAEIDYEDTTSNLGMAFDRDGNLWFGGAAVHRIPATALRGDLSHAADQIETFTMSEGLTGGTVSTFFEDREGNMWVGTYIGLDRFTRGSVIRVDPTGTFGVAVPAQDGTVWLSAVEAGSGPRYPLLRIQNGKILTKQSAPHFTAGFSDPDGSIWFGGNQGLVRYRDGRPEQPIPLPQSSTVQAMAQDSSGTIWVSISRTGLFRYSNSAWSAVRDEREALPAPPIAIATSSNGQVYLGYRDNRLTVIGPATSRQFTQSDGLQVGNITAVATHDQHVWIGGDNGLAHFDGTRFATIVGTSGNPFTGVSGIIAAADGDLWLNGNAGIVHLTKNGLDRALSEPVYRVRAELFDRLDGLRGYARQVRPSPSAVAGSDGFLWFATQVGLVGINPAQIVHNKIPPPVTIWSINGASTQFPAPPLTRLPVNTTNVRIEYTAASLAVPERVRFRYKLNGLDSDWQDVGERREAIYTNLAPGRYSFQVIASNNDGVWNDAGASIAFTIAPAFYQTRWFYGLCAMCFLALLWVLYVIRIQQVRAQLHARLGERLAERERIARDLHDTLLQSVQGLVLRFRVATARLSPQEPARPLMEQALDRADGVLEEGRNRVKDLRSSIGGDLALPQLIAAWGEEMAEEEQVHFRSTLEGRPRDLHPIVGEEVIFITKEALINAFRHAKAKQIEADISYGDSELLIRIRDNGRGIDEDVLHAGGREGHWGLLGMRERAKKIRASLTVWSKLGAGTEVELRLAAHIVYRVSRRINPLGSLFSRQS